MKIADWQALSAGGRNTGRHGNPRGLALALAIGLLLAVAAGWAALPAGAQEREPQFAIANQAFQDYHQKRGGVRTFGHPISRQFELHGFQVQLFQRGVLQALPGGGVATMNLLDAGLLPYTSFNFSVVPAPDRELIETAPATTDPDYASSAIAFVRANAPDQWEGLPVDFSTTFASTVRYEDAFPQGEGDPALVPLLNLELWGLPTSRPAYDPNNRGFVYQRFQRGIMHYDAATGATQGLLLGEYLKAIMTGRDLPLDLHQQAASSPFYRQYDAVAGWGPLRPGELPGTRLGSAFHPDGWEPAVPHAAGTAAGTAAVAGPASAASPTLAPRPTGPDPRFGVVVLGPGTNDPLQVSSVLSLLGAGSWYTFGENTAQVPGRVELVRPGADLGRVAATARAHPGRAWMIGNEPNVPGQDDLQPAAYADFLHRVSTAIRGADPTALLVGPNVLNWDKTCDGCPGYTAGHGWADALLADYSARYGQLPFDVWGMHTYSLDWAHPPLVNAPDDQAQLTAARAWLDAKGLKLPIWLTEFGVIWGFEGMEWRLQEGRWLGRPTGRFRGDLIRAYLDSMLGWLAGPEGTRAGVERWFLYATNPPPEPYATMEAGISLLERTRLALTPFGERFRAWATVAAQRE